jgi:hypothetical protein
MFGDHSSVMAEADASDVGRLQKVIACKASPYIEDMDDMTPRLSIIRATEEQPLEMQPYHNRRVKWVVSLGLIASTGATALYAMGELGVGAVLCGFTLGGVFSWLRDVERKLRRGL